MQLLPGLGLQGQSSQERLPAYSKESTNTPSNDEGVDQHSPSHHYRMDRPWNSAQSRLSQFLSHFTLGFADGLTVPFALTAGLSSLGHTRTVIYAGMAEICAGCISMGIGGYLAARGQPAAELDSRLHSQKLEEAGQDTVQSYLAPLDLPPDLLQVVQAHIDHHPTVFGRLSFNQDSALDDLTDGTRLFPPAVVGLSVSFGYLLGGLLPLFPYFFVGEVEDGLRWSFSVCILSLFAFGFAKDFLLHHGSAEGNWQRGGAGDNAVMWEKVKQGSFEGMRMVIMGGIAAIAAVLCVRFFEHVVL
ncbi:VIT family-domain-containing protein [Hypoxylon cercidicola]|nr:VIT family-domain-containing protein [Hypoxylon cercidicola]